MLWDRLKSLFKLPPELAELSREELHQVSREVDKRLLRDWRWWATLPLMPVSLGIGYCLLSVPGLRGFLAAHDSLITVFAGLVGAVGIQLQLWAAAPLKKRYLRAVLAERTALRDAGPYAGGAMA